jgi:hypothetical protein
VARAAVDRAEPRHGGDESNAFHASGAQVVGEFRCSGCGYGIVSRGVLPTCPMCEGAAWEESPWRPFTREPGRR